MPKKSMDTLTESMFYVLMAFRRAPACGIEVMEFTEQKTKGRLKMGPATLYTILAKFEQEKLIREVAQDGRKRTYCLTAKGAAAYDAEMTRLRACVADGESEVRGDEN